MAAAVDAIAEDAPVEFSSESEEVAYFQKLHRERSKAKQGRRMTMMGGLGLVGPQEHFGFFKLSGAIEDAPRQFALRAGSLLKR